jgi:hypothetical protein
LIQIFNHFRILKWPFEFATSHHDPVMVCGPLDVPEVMDGEGGAEGHIQRKLDQSGEVSSWFSDALKGRSRAPPRHFDFLCSCSVIL